MTMRRFSTIIFALLVAGCGRSQAINNPAADLAGNGTANAAGAVAGNVSGPPLVDNGSYSTVPEGNRCGSRTISVPCPGSTTRMCQQVVEGPPCPS